MKKIISLMLILVMIISVLAGCTSSNDQSGDLPDYLPDPDNPEGSDSSDDPDKNILSVTGVDAAKLLLAAERLNEKLLENEGDIFENGVEVMTGLANKAKENLGARFFGIDTSLGNGISTLSSTARNGILGEEKSDIGKMEIKGDTVEWSELDEVSNSYEYFINLTSNIVYEAQLCADLIDFVKKNIRIIDKWVVFGTERYYLSVGENEELLCNERGSGASKTVIVCHRYKNSAGKDVYEMYRYSNTHEARMTYIPGERYELSQNRKHHFVASNTKGYWENYVLGDEETHYNISYLVLKDDICYTFGTMKTDASVVQVLSSDRQTDLFNYVLSPEGNSMIAMQLNGFKNIKKITLPKDKAHFGENNSFASFAWEDSAEIHTENGKVIKQQQTYCDGKVIVSGIAIMSFGYGYGAELHIDILADVDEVFDLFKQFLVETGIECRRNIDTVISAANKSHKDAKTIYNYYKWNGHLVNTDSGIASACVEEKAKYDAIKSLYSAVSEKPEIVYDKMTEEELELHINFAPIVENTASGGKLTGDVLTLTSVSLGISDTTIIASNEAYHVAIALSNSSGALIHLDQAAPSGTKYSGEGNFVVSTGNIEIKLPVLRAGSYAVVAYIATSSGIRSSQYAALSFDAVEGTPVNLGSVDLQGTIEPTGALKLTYSERIDVHERLITNEKLDFAKFKELVSQAAFAYGMPDESLIEQVDGETCTALTGNESEIANGVYRIAYTRENAGVVSGGYLYVDYLFEEVTEGGGDQNTDQPEAPADPNTPANPDTPAA